VALSLLAACSAIWNLGTADWKDRTETLLSLQLFLKFTAASCALDRITGNMS
jgi:hypothetical protein